MGRGGRAKQVQLRSLARSKMRAPVSYVLYNIPLLKFDVQLKVRREGGREGGEV